MSMPDDLEGVAVIGMSGRFPKAKNIDEFWRNLVGGVECISFPSDEELLSAGIDATEMSHPDYVKAGCFLEDTDLFDASFFGISPKEAEMMDPQHRIFLEVAWNALEHAGYDPDSYEGEIGVYGGCTMSTYMLYNLNPQLGRAHSLPIVLGNDKDYLSTRISYKLNLKGPSVCVQSACSTSLVAVSLACDNLLDHQCSMALAGGIATRAPQKRGYIYEQGSILSPDGHCRAFDAKAEGTIFGSGVGVVVLKRLEDAIADGDTIYAVIKGTAVNNDGSLKVGYTAPSVEGQAKVVAMAQALAGISPDTITYVEAHGTGTSLGDPIEVAALTQAFRLGTQRKGFCALGSVKTNIGHLDSAAGIAGLIKTVLALKHKVLPPSLNFEQPNPDIDFENSPFYVNSKLSEWDTNGTPRRAGVSAFGIGGTNAHAVLEEAPAYQPSGDARPRQLLVISARTATALDTATANLAEHLKQNPDIKLADVAYTLGKGRQAFGHRRFLVCEDVNDAATALGAMDPKRVFTGSQEAAEQSVVFLFPGQGTQYVNMARQLFQFEPAFRNQVELCSGILKAHIGLDLRDVLYPGEERDEEAAQQLKQTAMTQPALFVIEYALARLWMQWGAQPQAMIGHSIGEYVAACLAGVMSLEDALSLVAARGELMQQLPRGSMLAVSLPEKEIQPLLSRHLSLAAVNGPSLCVVSGAAHAVEELQDRLVERGVECRSLHTSHAFHSEMMTPILASFTERVRRVNLKPPQIPYVSNVTGNWITEAEATDPSYWARHLRQTVRFADGLQQLLKEPKQILLEVGPGRTLSTLAKRQSDRAAGHIMLTSVPHPEDRQSDLELLLGTLGKLWLAGVKVDWSGFYQHEQRQRVPLPTYPFERKRYWMDLQKQSGASVAGVTMPFDKTQPRGKLDLADWFYTPSWKRSPLAAAQLPEEAGRPCTLVFVDECEVGSRLVSRLDQQGQDVIAVEMGAEFAKQNERAYTLNPRQSQDYDALLAELRSQGKSPQRIAHLWSVTKSDAAKHQSPSLEHQSLEHQSLEHQSLEHQALEHQAIDRAQDLGFYSLLFLAQALGRQDATETLSIAVVSNNLQEVTGEEQLSPEKATLLGPVKVIGQEYPNINCRSIDIVVSDEERLIDQLQAELAINPSDQIVAYRRDHRWVQTVEPFRLDKSAGPASRLKQNGVYLITGGLGGVGLTLAQHLAKTVQAKLVLVGRSALPPKEEWDGWLATHEDDDGASNKIRKVQELERLGAEVLVISADVAKQAQSVVAESLARFGHIDGVIHAAGVPAGGVIQLKTPEMVDSIMAPKIKGTLALHAALKGLQLDFFALCSSLTSIVGGFGQVDYCAANSFLDAFARHNNSGNGTLTVSINWDAWREVGMAAEAAKQSSRARGATAVQYKEVAHPLFDQCIIEGPDHETYITRFSTIKHWVLSDHKVTGAATLPGTAYLEMARAAFENLAGEGMIEIREVYFLAPLIVGEGQEKEVRTILKKQGDDFEFSILSKAESEKDSWQEHARGKIALMETTPLDKLDLEAIKSRCHQQDVTITEQQRKAQSGFMEFGPRWDNLKRVRYGTDQGLASLELPDSFAGDVESYKLHPALLDSATGFLTIKAQDGSPYLPFSYKRLRIKAPLPEKAYSYARFTQDNQPQSGTLKLDITITDDQGTALVEIEDYILRKIDIEKVAGRNEKVSAVLEAENFDLEIASPGILESLRYRPSARRKPAPDEIEIEVYATGLNFKEVLMALGLLSVPSGAGGGFGLECAGKVAALGEQVEGYSVGDEVVAFARPSFSPFVSPCDVWVAKKPKHLSFEEAASIPVAFLTAYYSLIKLGKLRQGERVLIHAAAGGVGLAAVQVAKWAGAEIFATAGNDEKRDFLRSLGVEHVSDSRSLSFAEEVMKQTDGKGVDVVLNSLGGEFITKSLSVMAPYGRFLEIGKRDIYSDTQIGLRPFEKCLSFFALDISPGTTPDLNSAWREMIQHFEEKTFHPLPCKVFPASEVSRAFEYMSRAAHIGKVVVSLEDKNELRRFAASTEEETASGPRWRPASVAVSRVDSPDKPVAASKLYEADPFAEGILPSEGAIAFSRILGSALPQIIVSARDFLNASFRSPRPAETIEETNQYKPSHPRPGLSNEYIAPRNEAEETIAQIWQNLLGIEQVGVYDNFFELGGDSLLAAQVIPRLREAFQVDVAVARMFEEPTVAGLAELVQTSHWSAQNIQTLDETEGDREEGRL